MDEKKTSNPSNNGKANKVVTGAVRQKKKNGITRFGDMIVPGDLDSAANYILQDVLIPYIQKALYDTICNGLGILLGQAPRYSKDNNSNSRPSYRAYYDQRSDRGEYSSSRSRPVYSYDDLMFDRRADAEEVLWQMEEFLEKFDVVSVADMLDFAGIQSNYTDHKYGWTNLRSARVESVLGGYRIHLPRAVAIT